MIFFQIIKIASTAKKACGKDNLLLAESSKVLSNHCVAAVIAVLCCKAMTNFAKGIAASVWGDASLWYMIAEANGLSGSEALVGGSSLVIPDKVVNHRNNAGTFEIYDPNRALGDLSPTAAKPPKKANK